jgi:hypothetical protein
MSATARALLCGAVALWLLCWQAPASLAIDQTPILRVVRVNDLPGAENLEPPSGALTASQFAANNNRARRAASEERRLLSGYGFRSSAMSAFEVARVLRIQSAAIELGSPARAARAARAEAELNRTTQLPPGAHASVSADTAVRHALLVTFRPGQAGWTGGYELVASAGRWLFTLSGIEKPDRVSRAQLERLLATVISRAAA